jgi:hypothetical protein
MATDPHPARRLAGSTLRRRALLLCLCLIGIGLGIGCESMDQKPIPILTVEIYPEEGAYGYNHQRVAEDQLHAELSRVAEDTRQPITNECRAYVRLIAHQGVTRDRVDALVSYCFGIGLVQIENVGSGY